MLQVSNVNYRKQKFQLGKSCFAIIKGEEIIHHFNYKSLDGGFNHLVKDIYEFHVGMAQHKEILYMGPLFAF